MDLAVFCLLFLKLLPLSNILFGNSLAQNRFMKQKCMGYSMGAPSDEPVLQLNAEEKLKKKSI